DIAITSPISGPGYLYIFYGGSVDNEGAFWGASNINATNYWVDAPANPLNKYHTEKEKPWPQIIQPATVGSGEGFGYGVSSAGDFNIDNYADVAVNVATGLYDQEITLNDAGYVLIYFGSDLGLRADSSSSTAPQCHGGSTPICNPFMVY